MLIPSSIVLISEDENIKMGKPNATDEEILEALEKSKMSDFIASHKEGLDYLLVGMGQRYKHRVSLRFCGNR